MQTIGKRRQKGFRLIPNMGRASGRTAFPTDVNHKGEPELANKGHKVSLNLPKLDTIDLYWGQFASKIGQQNSSTSSVSPELIHRLACSRLLRKLARQEAFIFIESKVIFRKKAMQARPRANPCNNTG